MNTTSTNIVVKLNDFYRHNRIKVYTEANTLTNAKQARRVIDELNNIPDVLSTSLTRDEVEQTRHEKSLSPIFMMLRDSFVITSDFCPMRPLYYRELENGPQTVIGLPKAHLDWGTLSEKYRAKDYAMSHGMMRDLYDQLIKNHKRFSKEVK